MTTKEWQPKLEDCPPSLLHTFVAFADQGGVSKAAAALGLDQPLVSRRLKVFIDGHGRGEGLLERVGPRGLRLTERGKALLPKVREVLAQYDALLAHLRGRQQAVEVVRLALGSFAAQLYLPPVLAAAKRQDQWRLDSRIGRGRERILGVADGRFELALVTHAPEDIAEFSAGRPPLRIELLAKHAVAVIAPTTSEAGAELASWPAERPLPVDKLTRWPLVGLDEHAGLCRKLQGQLRGRGTLQLANGGQPGGWTLGREYARHGLGVALLPLPLLISQDRKDFVVRRLSSTFAIEVFLVLRKSKLTRAQSDVLRLFHKIAGESIQHLD